MKNSLRFVSRRVLEHVYFITGFPIIVALFVIVTFGWTTLFVPIFAVLILVLLQAMQAVSWFEVKRANLLLASRIRVVDDWFSYPFFSWSGVRERFVSARSWLAIVYIVVNFFIGTVGFALSILSLAIATSSFAVPVGAIIAATTGSLVPNGAMWGVGFRPPGVLEVGNTVGLPTAAIVVVVTVLLLATLTASTTLVWLIGRLQIHFVNGFLSNGYLPTVEQLGRRATKKLRVSEKEVRKALHDDSDSGALGELSPREKEVLALMAQGKSNAGIAQVLFITEGSVEKHVSNILQKLNLPVDSDSHRRVQAVLAYLNIEPGVSGDKSEP